MQHYSIELHCHRFAAWAASRAASTKVCRFAVIKGIRALEACGFSEHFTHDKLPPASETDSKHQEWRETICNRDDIRIEGMTHGVAAKLINIYMKTRFVCGGFAEDERVKALHPPIDRLLLNSMAQNNFGGASELWMHYRNIGWSNFNDEQYTAVINKIRESCHGTPLWKIEYFWQGHQ